MNGKKTTTGCTAIATAIAMSALALNFFVPTRSAFAQAQGDDGRPVIKVPRRGGRELFQDCVLCHKYDGRGGASEGGYAADLRVTTLTRAQLIHVITYGRRARGMPAFEELLEAAKIETLADFILTDLRLPEQRDN
jgi:mono/diheme cytochrome c family protein